MPRKQHLMLLFMLFLLALSTVAAEEISMEEMSSKLAMETDKKLSASEGKLLFYGDVIIYILIVLLPVVIISTMAQFKKSAVGTLLTYLLIGIILIGLSVFIYIQGSERFKFEQLTFSAFWHLPFYLGIISFILAGTKTKKLVGKLKEGSNLNDTILIIILVALALFEFYNNPIIHMIGLHHIVAFLFAGIAGTYFLFMKKNLGKLFSLITTTIFLALIFLSLHHLLELLGNNWKILVLPQFVSEGLAKFIIIIVYVLILISFNRTKRFLSTAKF